MDESCQCSHKEPGVLQELGALLRSIFSGQPPRHESPLRTRSSGILLHPTSLPSRYGIGDLGPTAYAWLDLLARAKQQWWQVLPLAPTGYADSPYQCLSTFAGNPNLISPDELVREGLLKKSDIELPSFDDAEVDFGRVLPFKTKLLVRAWENLKAGSASALKESFEKFCFEESVWLEDFALFMALKEAHGGASWLTWETELRERKPAALSKAKETLRDAIEQQKFRQFLFFRQWNALRVHARSLGVKVIGDIPIFVASDSSDVWSHPEGFLLDAQRRPTVVAGVPPDYFSKTGQLWGNPLYNWPAMRKTGYAWWIERVRAALKLVDLVRVDHFRGFEANWEVPAGNPTAEIGRWAKGPGSDLFDTLAREIGELSVLAEDLGVITPEVDALRTRYNFPGMRILQFAFAGAVEDRFLPHNYETNTVVYTGTHDNDTTRGWFVTSSETEQELLRRYVDREVTEENVSWCLMRLAWGSVAKLAVAPLQDVLALGTEARMNLPGQPSGWWRWRVTQAQLTEDVFERLGEMTESFGRSSERQKTPAAV